MILLLLHILGLGWLATHAVFHVFSFLFSCVAILILFTKGYAHFEEPLPRCLRGIVLLLVLFGDGFTGLLVAVLLEDLPLPDTPSR